MVVNGTLVMTVSFTGQQIGEVIFGGVIVSNSNNYASNTIGIILIMLL
jgi:hypothetical protein